MTFNLSMSMFKVFDLCFEVGSCNIKKATSFLVYHGKPLIHPNSMPRGVNQQCIQRSICGPSGAKCQMLTKPKKLGTGPSWALTHFLEEFVFSIDQTKFRCSNSGGSSQGRDRIRRERVSRKKI